MKILVAYDGSVCGDGALYDLASAGLPAQADVYVVTFSHPYPRFIPSLEPGAAGWAEGPESDRAEQAPETLAEAESMAERAGRYLASRFPGWKIRAKALPDLPAQGILSQSEAWKPNLIVVGTHGRSSLGRLILGSVSHKVLMHSRFPVRLSRARIGADPSAPRILLAMDGSPGSFAAVDAVASRQWPRDTAIRILAVVDTRQAMEGVLYGSRRPGERRAERGGGSRSWIDKRLKEAAAKLSSKGLTVTQEIRLGEPRRAILRAAKEWPAHCIFMGSRGLNPFQRFLMGSVSTAVAFHAACSVEVVRKAKAPATGTPEDPANGAAAKGKAAALRISARIRKRSALRGSIAPSKGKSPLRAR
jgi:nucleotide-binding universal stress UspA family protein